MDLTLTRRGDYVVRAALALGAAPAGAFQKIAAIAAAMDLPRSYTPRVLKLLAEAGLAESRAGQAGGYRLMRDPGEITLLEVVEAGDGPLRPDRCTLRGGPCHWADMCALHDAWDRSTRAMRDSLAQTTLADLVEQDRRLQTGTAEIPRDSHRRSGL